MNDLLGRLFGRGAKNVMVGGPNDPVFAQGRAVAAEPAPHPEPGNNRIKEPGQGIDGDLAGPRNRTRIVYCQQMQTVLGRLEIKRSSPDDELFDAPPHFRKAPKTRPRKTSITKQDSCNPPKRKRAQQSLRETNAPGNRMTYEAASQNDALNGQTLSREERPDDLRSE